MIAPHNIQLLTDTVIKLTQVREFLDSVDNLPGAWDRSAVQLSNDVEILRLQLQVLTRVIIGGEQ